MMAHVLDHGPSRAHLPIGENALANDGRAKRGAGQRDDQNKRQPESPWPLFRGRAHGFFATSEVARRRCASVLSNAWRKRVTSAWTACVWAG